MGFNSGFKGLTALNKHPCVYLVIKQRQNGGRGARKNFPAFNLASRDSNVNIGYKITLHCI